MRIAVITGASSGMGREFVLQLSRTEKLDEIWVIARRLERLEALQKEIESVKPTLCVCLGNRANSIMYDVITETEYPELLISSITLPHLSGTARGAIVKQFEKQLKGMRATANNIAEVYAKEIIDKINGGSRKS
jgi:NAD(P)-dependent dehydrogenase (short-subunit alcohol dehydrogenase family)